MNWHNVLLTACLWSSLLGGVNAQRANGAGVQFVVLETDSNQPVPCRIHLKGADGKVVQPRGLPFWHDHFVCGGTAQLDLSVGSYRYEIERGPEYLATIGKLTVSEGGGQSITNRLRRLVNLSKDGWWSGEMHVHRPLADIPLLMQAEDLHVAPVITWWNSQNPWQRQPLPAKLLVQFDHNRFYHVLGGEDERGGGALLFYNLSQPLDLTGAGREYPSPMRFLREARQQPGAWVDLEKPFWYDTPVWLASGMVDSIGIAHNHMQRDGVMATEAWGRARDKRRLPDPQGNGFWTQEIYYQALNCGLRLPPSAGSASGVLANPVGYDRLYVHLDGDLTYEQWWEGLRAGRVFVSNGPLLRCRANGEWPGHIFQVPAGQRLALELNLALDSRDPIAAIEIIKNGQVLRTVPFAEWKRTGTLGKINFEDSGWFLVRAIADLPNNFRFASTGPYYVEAGTTPRRVSKASAQFFLDWVRERMGQIKLGDPREQTEVIKYHQEAERFWQQKLAEANAP
jgi:hypothetical protein